MTQKSPPCVIVSDRSGAGSWLIVVRSLAELLAVLVSPGVETVTVLVTLVPAAAVGRTTRSKPLFPLAAMTVGRVQVTVCPAAEHVQPLAVPFLMKVKPVGKVSVTVTTPVVAAAVAAFLTVIR